MLPICFKCCSGGCIKAKQYVEFRRVTEEKIPNKKSTSKSCGPTNCLERLFEAMLGRLTRISLTETPRAQELKYLPIMRSGKPHPRSDECEPLPRGPESTQRCQCSRWRIRSHGTLPEQWEGPGAPAPLCSPSRCKQVLHRHPRRPLAAAEFSCLKGALIPSFSSFLWGSKYRDAPFIVSQEPGNLSGVCRLKWWRPDRMYRRCKRKDVLTGREQKRPPPQLSRHERARDVPPRPLCSGRCRDAETADSGLTRVHPSSRPRH